MKNFDEWNILKKKMDVSEKEIYPKAGEVWWVSIGENVGDEECGKNILHERPVLVLSILTKNIFLGVPLSSVNKENHYYIKFNIGEKEVSAMAMQLKVFDRKRISRSMVGVIEKVNLKMIKSKISKLVKL